VEYDPTVFIDRNQLYGSERSKAFHRCCVSENRQQRSNESGV
jgi:hypothetical protein